MCWVMMTGTLKLGRKALHQSEEGVRTARRTADGQQFGGSGAARGAASGIVAGWRLAP